MHKIVSMDYHYLNDIVRKSVRCKNREKYAPKKNNHTRQYLHGSTIFLRLQSCSDFTIHSEKI